MGVHASVVRLGAPVSPVRWSDNDVTLFASEQVELAASYPVSPGHREAIQVEGFNVPGVAVGPMKAPKAFSRKVLSSLQNAFAQVGSH